MPSWSWLLPLTALACLIVGLRVGIGPALATVCAGALIGAVIAAVHHAEVVAQRIGEPLGTLVLSVAVTVIEVSLIVSVLLASHLENATLARDTIFAVVMITCNGLIGLSLLIGALRHREQSFHVIGSNAGLATLCTLTTLSLVLPTFTVSSSGPTYTSSQLLFASVTSLSLWGVFVFVQAVRHRDYFLAVGGAEQTSDQAPTPTGRMAAASLGVLLLALGAVVGLAELLSHPIEEAIAALGAPKTMLSIVIAVLTLMPEGWAALRAARADRLQISLNLSLGSALASIGLTIPAVAFISLLLGAPIVLGLAPTQITLLALTFLIASITLVAGRTHVLQGAVHLVIFAAFVFFALVP